MSNGATRYPHMGVGSGVGFTVMWCWMPELRKRSPALDSSGDDRRFHATSPTLKTPRRHLLPWNPPRKPPSQVLSLRNQTLVNRTGEQGDAVLADLIAEVLTGNTDA